MCPIKKKKQKKNTFAVLSMLAESKRRSQKGPDDDRKGLRASETFPIHHNIINSPTLVVVLLVPY